MVDDHQTETLFDIINDKCLDGTTYFSDCWNSYQKNKRFYAPNSQLKRSLVQIQVHALIGSSIWNAQVQVERNARML